LARAVVSTVLDAPVEVVWRLLGHFNGWPEFLPRIVTSDLEGGAGRAPVGAVRRLILPDGRTACERLVQYDSVARSLTYEFDGPHPFPVRTYTGSVRVRPVTVTGTTFVEWSGEFDADESDEPVARQIFEGIYVAFLADLEDHLHSSWTNPTVNGNVITHQRPVVEGEMSSEDQGGYSLGSRDPLER
jgi:hypothetical protein